MSDNIRHIVSTATNATTVAVGGAVASLTLESVQFAVGIVAAVVGIVATVCVTRWRYREYKQRMKILGDDNTRGGAL